MKNGDEHPIDDSAAPVRNRRGDIIGSILVFPETSPSAGTPRRRCAGAKQELNDFFENASVGLHWVGPDGIIQRINQTELNGWVSAEWGASENNRRARSTPSPPTEESATQPSRRRFQRIVGAIQQVLFCRRRERQMPADPAPCRSRGGAAGGLTMVRRLDHGDA